MIKQGKQNNKKNPAVQHIKSVMELAESCSLVKRADEQNLTKSTSILVHTQAEFCDAFEGVNQLK